MADIKLQKEILKDALMSTESLDNKSLMSRLLPFGYSFIIYPLNSVFDFVGIHREIIANIEELKDTMSQNNEMTICSYDFWYENYFIENPLDILYIDKARIKSDLEAYCGVNNSDNGGKIISTKVRKKLYEPENFDALFDSIKKYEFTINALKYFHIINNDEVYILGLKSKYRLAAFIRAFKIRNIIPETMSEEVLQNLFCDRLGIEYKRMKAYNEKGQTFQDTIDEYIKKNFRSE